jgi:hypothetical protein
MRRNDSSSCVYERNPTGRQNEQERHHQAEARLEHLENLVLQLSQPAPFSTNESISTPEDHIAGRGDKIQNQRELTSLLDSQSHYNGSTHWSAMLEDIEELRFTITNHDHLDNGVSSNGSSNVGDGIAVLFGATSPLPYQEILSCFLPPRREVDRLSAAYFRAKAVAAPFVHAGQFNRLYQSFWDDPLSTSPLWASTLFSILDIATKTLSLQSSALQNGVEESIGHDRFAIAAAHCLASGEYYRPKRFAVEALLLYAQRMCLTSVDMSQDLAIIFGTLVRLATTLGYHRDPQNSRTGLSVFESEMRRRTWSLCMQLDLLVSFQLGIPTNVQYPTWDTGPPSNLLDSDFNETTMVLPPARPDSEPTELLFYIAKHKLMAVFEKIIRHTLSTSSSTVNDLEFIDQELRDTYAALPPVFHPRPMSKSIADSPSIIVTRLCVESIYQKCLCVLHRKYVTRGRAESIQTCYVSASSLVQRFLDVYEEFQPGGQLETERWFMSSITWHDFLLGCMALCLVLCAWRQASATTDSCTKMFDLATTIKRLQSARNICEEQSTRSKDTRKVQHLIDTIILKFSDESTVENARMRIFEQGGHNMKAGISGKTSHSNDNWFLTENTMVDADEWAYLEQFLDLPNSEFLTHF